jgi:hypothetical protein
VHPDDRTVEIVPIEKPVTVRRQYRLRYTATEGSELGTRFPEATIRIDDKMAVVDARVEDQERIAEVLNGRTKLVRSARPTSGAQQGYTLRVEQQPVRNILKHFHDRLGWEIETDEEAIRAAELSLEVRVTLAVEKVTQDELLKAVLQPAGLDYKKDGTRIRIVPGRDTGDMK